MNLFRSAGAIATASGDEAVDWDAVSMAAKGIVDPGSLDLEPGEREAYATDVRDARTRVREISGVQFDLPDRIEVQHRHHWIDANVGTFRKVTAPLSEREVALPGVARRLNTATMSGALAFLGNNVLGQYDPLLLADAPHALYFVRPNIVHVADELDVEYARFRRWIAFHEVTHAAEFGAAPWLSTHLEERVEKSIAALAEGRFRRDALRELDVAMTAVEGYAEFVMDRAFDDDFADLREKVDARRRGGGPITALVRRLLGLGLKRRQYERGKAFFDEVVRAGGPEVAPRVWDGPENLPREEELDEPSLWLARVG